MDGRSPEDIGTDRQLFVDNFWISEARGVTRTMHHPERKEVAIAGEHPWEQRAIGCAGFMHDGDRFRAWYRCAVDEASTYCTAYAESIDGIHWEKPKLGLFEFGGSKENNLVWMGPGTNLAPFRDPNPDVPDDERYKGVARTEGSMGSETLMALVSPDGIRWRLLVEEPILTEGPYDSPNVSFWDDRRREYVAYVRGIIGCGTPGKRKKDISIWKEGVRWIRRSTSRDFRQWTKPELIQVAETSTIDHYSNACILYDRAPGMYLIFSSRFNVERQPDPEHPDSGVSDIVFMSSRDGLHFDSSFREAFIRPGLDKNNWHDRGVYIERGILHTTPGEISLYGMENSHLATVRIRRYALRTDGFVSVRAGYEGGGFITRPLIFSGKSMELNYSTSAVGSVHVEIQDINGNPQPGFTLDDCPEMFADEIEGAVAWKGGSDVSALAGKPVRLHFTLNDADIYAFKFNS